MILSPTPQSPIQAFFGFPLHPTALLDAYTCHQLEGIVLQNSLLLPLPLMNQTEQLFPYHSHLDSLSHRMLLQSLRLFLYALGTFFPCLELRLSFLSSFSSPHPAKSSTLLVLWPELRTTVETVHSELGGPSLFARDPSY